MIWFLDTMVQLYAYANCCDRKQWQRSISASLLSLDQKWLFLLVLFLSTTCTLLNLGCLAFEWENMEPLKLDIISLQIYHNTSSNAIWRDHEGCSLTVELIIQIILSLAWWLFALEVDSFEYNDNALHQ